MNIEVDGYNIFYKVTGEGEQTAVILQGWGTNCEIYDSVANTINDTYRVIQFDLPGFGASDEPREPWSVDDYADFFCKFMEALGIGRAVLIGHSYGGRMIIKLAARKDCGFEIARIVLIDSAGIMPKRSFKKRMRIKKYKVLKKLFNIKLVYALFPELIDAWRSQQGSEDYKNAVMIGDSWHDANGAELLGVDFLGVTYGFDFHSKEDVEKCTNVGSADTPLELLKYFE